MALIARELKQVAERIRYFVDCDSWLATGEVLAAVTAVVDSGAATVDTIQVDHTGRAFHYFVNGGDYRDQFNVIFTQTTSIGQIRYDHSQFNIQTNGGDVVVANTQQLMLSILGPLGPTGYTGPGGSASNTGATGPFGPPGVVGPLGPTGPQGTVGATGAAGQILTSGSIFTGNGAPSNSLGNNNDIYIDNLTDNLYQKQSGVWVLQTNIKGQAGPQGIQGTQGVQGPTGPTGLAGSNGAAGATGPTGVQGTAGTNGAAGAAGPTGFTGAAGANGAAGATGPTGFGVTGPTGPAGGGGGTGAGPTGPTGPAGGGGSLSGSPVPYYNGIGSLIGLPMFQPIATSTYTFSSAAHAVLMPFYIDRPIVVTDLFWIVSAARTTSSVRLLIYNATNPSQAIMTGGSLVYDSGQDTTSANTVGQKQKTGVNTTLPAGFYFLVFACGTGSGSNLTLKTLTGTMRGNELSTPSGSWQANSELGVAADWTSTPPNPMSGTITPVPTSWSEVQGSGIAYPMLVAMKYTYP